MAVHPVPPHSHGSSEGGGHSSHSDPLAPFKQLILWLLIAAAAYFGYTLYAGNNDTQVSSIPRAMQITYMPADFKIDLAEGPALEILSNPQKYKREFSDLIFQFNTALVSHVCNRMGLDANTRALCLEEYRKMHPMVNQLYYNDFASMSDTTSQLYRTWYENQSAGAADLLNEVAGKYTCFFITNIMSTVLKTQDGKLSVKGAKVETPCGIALMEGLRPTVKRLQDAAAIRDFAKARGLLKEKVERSITELAVKEVRDKKGIRVNNSTKVMGYNVSKTDFDVTAISIIKVGFNLNNFFDVTVDNANHRVIVTLPQPQILSHEVYPKVENLDVGWMREINPQDFNDNINKLRQAFRDDAYNSTIFTESKQRALEIMQLILLPAVRGISRDYKVAVAFQQPTVETVDVPTQQQQVQTQLQAPIQSRPLQTVPPQTRAPLKVDADLFKRPLGTKN